MKKSYYTVLALASLLLCCDPNGGGGETPDPVGTTYPRLQVIEHFTGQGCGYCPNGMNQIYEVYSQNPDGYIWITNHTYNKDDFTISESNTIAKKLKVSGAPEISLDRTKYDGSRTYHPYYLASYTLKEATTATSVVSLSRQYDAATHELTITATGKTGDQDLDSVLLTVAITESGVIATQEDYMYTWEGWQKFVHTHAVRMFATAALGDPVRMKNRTFSATYKVTLKEKWVADNCEIVAWITPGADNWPVLNAAKLAVVEGTQGGEDIRHGRPRAPSRQGRAREGRTGIVSARSGKEQATIRDRILIIPVPSARWRGTMAESHFRKEHHGLNTRREGFQVTIDRGLPCRMGNIDCVAKARESYRYT